MIPDGLITAFAFLTRLPVPRTGDWSLASLNEAKPYFPAVGLVIGAALAGVYWIVSGHAPSLIALVTVTVWIWITGALHLDGLGDVADALGASHADPDRFHAVLKDPHAGNFAVVTIALQIAAKLTLVAQLPPPLAAGALLLIPSWARWGALVWSAVLPPLRPGLGKAISTDPHWISMLSWGAALGGASLLLAPHLLTAFVVIAFTALFWRWRLGGITGDCLGASVEICETLLLLLICFVGK